MFSAREGDWQKLKDQLAVQGEGKLFDKGRYVRVQSEDEQLLSFPEELQLDSFRELRRLLDSVVAGLDKVTSLREQLSNRQQEIREFLARQAHADEKQWAMDFSRSVFNLMQFLSAVFLGRISDRVGRKPVLYLGLAAAATSQTLFGLGKSVGYAVCGGRKLLNL